MSVNDHRKCAKCGKTRSKDETVTYHRFPNPGKANITKARAWAKYCWPDQNWISEQSLESLYKSNKVLCGRHFSLSQFYDNRRQKLSKFAVPDEKIMVELLEHKENVYTQNEQESNENVATASSVMVLRAPETTENSSSSKQLESTLSINNTADDVTLSAPREFSWQKPPEAIPCADDVGLTDVLLTAPDSAGGDGDDDMRPIESYNDRLHIGFKCNECGNEIVGYRYTCVQCCDFDLCSSCEASGAHPEHYVLRLPRPEPAGAVKGVLETLRGLLDHEPLSQLDLDKVKKEEDEDPLLGLQPLAPVPPEEPDDFGPKGQEKFVLEMLPIDSTETDTDVTVADTAQVQHQTNVDSSNKTAPIVQNSSHSKKLLLSVMRIKKPTEVKTILDSDIVKLSSSMGPVQIGVVPAGMSTGVGTSGADVTVPRAKVDVPEVAMKLRTGVTVPRAGVRLLRTDVRGLGSSVIVPEADARVSEAGVTDSGAALTMPGAGVKVPRAKVGVPEAAMKLRTGVTVPRAGMKLLRTDVRRLGSSVTVPEADARVSEAGVTESGAAMTVPGAGVTVPRVKVAVPEAAMKLRTGVTVSRAGMRLLRTDVRVLGTGVTVRGTGLTVPEANARVSEAGVTESGAAMLMSEAGVTVPGTGMKVPGAGLTLPRDGVRVSGDDVRVLGAEVTVPGARTTAPKAAVKLSRAGGTEPRAGVRTDVRGSEADVHTVRGTGVTVPGAEVRVSEAGVIVSETGLTVPGTRVSVPRDGVGVSGVGVRMTGVGVRMTEAGVRMLRADVRVSETSVSEPGDGVIVSRKRMAVPRAVAGVSGAGVRFLGADMREPEVGVTEPGAGVTVPRTRVSVSRVRVGVSEAGVRMSGAGATVSVAAMRVSGPAPKGATVVNVERLEVIELKGTKRRKINDIPKSKP